MSTEQLQSLQNTLLETMKSLSTETNTKIETLQSTVNAEISNLRGELTAQTSRIDKIEHDLQNSANGTNIEGLMLEIERLKQDKLRNNLRLTGLPPAAFDDPDDLILRITALLDIDIIPSDYSVYADRNKSSIIVCFESHSLKRMMMDNLRKKKTLFVEEIYESIKSNSRVFANDQLAPYFAKLFQCAWRAKNEGHIASASSLGGRIRVKKTENSPLQLIETESQLRNIITSIEKMETQSLPTEESHRSQVTNQLTEGKTTPTSINSQEARDIRGKQFTYVSRPANPSNHKNFNSSTASNSNHSQRYQREHHQKRNNRHINTLDHRAQQPTHKKKKPVHSPQSNPSRASRGNGDFDSYRRDYQNRLRSFHR